MSTIIREIKEALAPDTPIASFESAGLLVQGAAGAIIFGSCRRGDII